MNAAPDQAARDRILHELDETLFVEAGAGSGKTTALVDRVLGLVTTGRAELRSIAAITFTEKAGAELRDRLRRQLEEASDAATATGNDPEVVSRCRTAIDQLDGAAIGTLHAFAQRVLAENPVEAGLPPRVEVLDEVNSDVEFERRWVAFRDHLFADPELERTILLLLASGVKPDALRVLAIEFDRNWDLVEERVPDDAPEPPQAASVMADGFAALDDAVALLTHCIDPGDKLALRLGEIEAYARQLRLVDDELDLIEALQGIGLIPLPKFTAGNIGKRDSWGCDKAEVVGAIRAAGEALDDGRRAVSTACAERVAVALRRFTLQAAAERRAAGRLMFHDLLVLSRSLVRDPVHGAAVRERLGSRYTHLLLDEFQDTDPIQAELAVRIAAALPTSPEAGTAIWSEV
ncbi:MAG TPA: UvrD-helicase domain-containing protein, partial [Acidimicrobiales bacterium]